MSPDKQVFLNKIDEIQEKVEEIFKLTVKSKKNEIELKNQKIIAWLLNRNKEAQSNERQQFF